MQSNVDRNNTNQRSCEAEVPWRSSTEFRRSYHRAQIICIIGLFVTWEAAEQFWIIRLPSSQQQLAHVAGIASFTLLTVALFYRMVLRYEARLESLNTQLQMRNEELRALEVMRDARLVQLSQELSLSIAELISRNEVALQSTTDTAEIKDLSDAIDHIDRLYDISRELINLKWQANGALPPGFTQPVAAGQEQSVTAEQPLAGTEAVQPAPGPVTAKRKVYAST